MHIKITKVPDGIAPKHIREAWVGIEMPAKPDKENSNGWSGKENAGGYIVSGTDAVAALLNAGKTEAVAYWSNPAPPTSLRFGADCCEVVAQ